MTVVSEYEQNWWCTCGNVKPCHDRKRGCLAAGGIRWRLNLNEDDLWEHAWCRQLCSVTAVPILTHLQLQRNLFYYYCFELNARWKSRFRVKMDFHAFKKIKKKEEIDWWICALRGNLFSHKTRLNTKCHKSPHPHTVEQFMGKTCFWVNYPFIAVLVWFILFKQLQKHEQNSTQHCERRV